MPFLAKNGKNILLLSGTHGWGRGWSPMRLPAHCAAGTYSNGTACVECERGTYTEEEAQSNCTNCPSGTSTVSTASSNSSECIVVCEVPTLFEATTTPSAGTYVASGSDVTVACSTGFQIDGSSQVGTLSYLVKLPKLVHSYIWSDPDLPEPRFTGTQAKSFPPSIPVNRRVYGPSRPPGRFATPYAAIILSDLRSREGGPYHDFFSSHGREIQHYVKT
eukprot:sb/3469905/